MGHWARAQAQAQPQKAWAMAPPARFLGLGPGAGSVAHDVGPMCYGVVTCNASCFGCFGSCIGSCIGPGPLEYHYLLITKIAMPGIAILVIRKKEHVQLYLFLSPK